ncbi:hypothetical protein VTO73DRAFT_13308 [Trametes versicolor]
MDALYYPFVRVRTASMHIPPCAYFTPHLHPASASASTPTPSHSLPLVVSFDTHTLHDCPCFPHTSCSLLVSCAIHDGPSMPSTLRPRHCLAHTPAAPSSPSWLFALVDSS